MGRRSLRAGIVAGAVPTVVLAAAWVSGALCSVPPLSALPIGNEPYRYLHAPPGSGSSPGPMSASKTVTSAQGAAAQIVELDTSDLPPQATIIFSTGGFTAAGQRVVVRITPVVPPALPSHGRIDGNVYQFSATRSDLGGVPKPVGLARGQVMTVALRAPKASGTPTLDRLDGGTWRALATTRVPQEDYSGSTDRFGYFALVLPAVPAGGGSAGVIIGVVLGGALLAVGAPTVLVRRARGRST